MMALYQFLKVFDMRPTHKLPLLVVILVLALTAAPGCAFLSLRCAPECHYSSFGVRAGAPSPKSPGQSVRMDSLDVTMRLRKSSYTVDTVCRFFNTGETTREWFGIPKRGNACKGDRLLNPVFISFHSWVDGRRIELAESRDLIRDTANTFYTLYYSRSRAAPCDETYYRWLGAYLTFPAQTRTTVRISYEADYVHGGEMPPRSRAIYILGTACYWKDSIRNFSFTIDASRVGGQRNVQLRRFPRVSLLTEDAVGCEIRDFEPRRTQEVEVAVVYDR